MRNTTLSFVALLALVGCEPIDPKDLEDNDADGVLAINDCDDEDPESTVVAEDADCDGVLTADDCDDDNPEATLTDDDADCDGVLTADDCDDASADVGSNADDADCDGVATADDCDDSSADLGAVADDADCDGVVAADDCDDADPDLGADCAVCIEEFHLNATLIAHNSISGNAPFIEGTAGRAIGVPDNPYTQLASPDLFDEQSGLELAFPTADSANGEIVFVNPQGLGELSSDGNLYGSFAGSVLDVNNPDEFYYRPETEQAFRHYKGGTYYIYGLDDNSQPITLATFNIVDLLLIVEWGQILLGDGNDALKVEAILETVEDTTGFFGVDPTVPSIHLVSDDAVIQQDGVSALGQWAAYTSDTHTFATLSTSLECEPEEEPEECASPDDMDCDGVVTAEDCDDSNAEIGSNVDDADCDGIVTAEDCDDSSADVGSNLDDADCDGVATADDCDDSSVDLGAVADDADCDGVATADDCDDADPNVGEACPVCFEPFDMSASLMGHTISNGTPPFIQGTTTRALAVNDNPYTELSSPDLFDEVSGDVLAYPSVDTPTSFEIQINNPQDLVPLNPGEGIYGSFSGTTLDVNNPSEFYYDEVTEQSFRHYKGGSLHLQKVDGNGVVTTLASYSILDLVLTIEWGWITSGVTAGAMHAEVFLDVLSDTTGVLGVDPTLPSIAFESNDAVVHVDGNSAQGPWEMYTASVMTFTPISASEPCQP